MSGQTEEHGDQIARLVRCFETTWRKGEEVPIESFLEEVPEGPARNELQRLLLAMELSLRQDDGELFDTKELLARSPGDKPIIRSVVAAPPTSTDVGNRPPDDSGAIPELPDYVILEVVGRGGMGVVYKARHRKLHRLAAIKVIHAGKSADRFRREARLISKIQSPHVVAVHDFRVLSDGRLALVMEYVDGTDLREAMNANQGRIPEDLAVRWMSDVCDGMIAAAEEAIIHRDIKPANILISAKNRALIADFGLARSKSMFSDMTLSDSVMGTPHYMAPEQAEDPRGVDTRADIYSFGATFYHALTGETPFDGRSIFSILSKAKSEPLISPRSRNSEISERICSILERCLAKSPGDRFPSFAAVRRQLSARPGSSSPWDMTEDSELARYLRQYQSRRDSYLEDLRQLPPSGDEHIFPGGRKVVILCGDITKQAVDAIVSSDTYLLTMNYGVSEAISNAGGPVIAQEASRYKVVRPGRAVVTSAGRLKARYVFHGVTVGLSSGEVVIPSRNLIAEIMSSCFYHADSLQIKTIAFPLMGTGAMGFSRSICLDTMFQSLARLFLHSLSTLREARIVLFNDGG